MSDHYPDPLQAMIAEHGPFMQRISRALVGDPERAADLVQDAWADILRRPDALKDVMRSDSGGVRGWLAVVLRRRLTSQLRRTRPAEKVPDALASGELGPDETSTRLERQTLVQDALYRLDEPYRTAIVQQFQDGLSAAEVARRTGTPASTLRSQVARGLEMLREELDRRHPGGRAEWLGAVLPLAYPRAAATLAGTSQAATVSTTSLLTALTMKKIILATCVALAAILIAPRVGSMLLTPSGPTGDRNVPLGDTDILAPPEAPGAVAQAVESVAPLGGDPCARSRVRTGSLDEMERPADASAAVAAETELAMPASNGGSLRISGRVQLFDGTPVAGERVQASLVEASGNTSVGSSLVDADGRFSIEGLNPGTYDVKVSGHWAAEGATLSSVEAPAEDLDLRIDAILLRASFPETLDLASLDGGGHEIVRLGDEHQSSSVLAYGGPQVDAQGVTQELLPAGPGYAVLITSSEGPGYVAMIEAGVPSGAYDVEFVSESPLLAGAEVVLSGAALAAPGRVTVAFERTVGGDRDDYRISLFFEEGTRRQRTGLLLPGEYSVTTRVFGPPPSSWVLPSVLQRSLELEAGDDALVEVQLVDGGGLALTINDPGADPPSAGFRLKIWDQASEAWKRHGTYVPVDDGFQVSSALKPGVLYRSWEPLRPGEARFRVTAEGYQTQEATVAITTAAFTEWSPRMERLP